MKYFFGLEKQRAQSKVMTRMYDSAGHLTCNPNQVLRIQSQFYRKLYTCDTQIDCSITNEPDRKLSENDKKLLDSEITMDELTQAVKQMARNKTPGPSGFQINLYGTFWTRLKEPLSIWINIKNTKERQRLGIR